MRSPFCIPLPRKLTTFDGGALSPYVPCTQAMLPLAMIYDAVDPYMSAITMFLISFCLLGFELLLVAEPPESLVGV